MERRSALLSPGRPEVIGPVRDKKPKTTRSSRQCSISALFYLLLGFQLSWLFIGITQRGGGWAELKEIEKRLADNIERVSKGQDVRISLMERNLTALVKNNSEPTVGLGLGPGLVWNLGSESEKGGKPEADVKGRPRSDGGEAAADGNLDPANIGEPACNPQDTERRKGTVLWNPKLKRYLLAMCSGGQLSNRLACLRQNMLDAALLNRTLLLPTTGIDYNYTDLLDLGAVQHCFGAKLVISLEEYRQTIDTRVRVGRFICHVHTYQTEDVCQQLVSRYQEDLGIVFAKQDIARRRTPGPWFKYPSSDFIRKFSSDHHLVAFGNMFGVGGRELRFDGAAPLVVKENCRGFIQPSKAIQETATGFVNSYLGTTYMAVHLRRGDFFQHCLKGPGRTRRYPCFHPIRQVAACLAQKLRQHPTVGMLFLATNAEDMELAVLRQVLEYEGKKVPVVRLPPMQSQPWAEPLERRGLEGEREVVSLVDKTICAMASVFLGTWGSTFTHDIFRLRDWWRHGSSCDGYVCEMEEPADILPVRNETRR